MMTVKKLVLAMCICIMSSSVANAMRVAVFPVEDLSKGKNGVNFEFTSYLAKEIAGRNVELISQQAVISFMVRNRIRWVGFLDYNNILKAGQELDCEFILLGTLDQTKANKAGGLPVYGLTFFLVRTTDARTVWSNSKAVSIDDVQRLLGINEPQTGNELLAFLVQEAISGWPARIDTDIMQQSILEIENVILEPRFAQPGEKVKCIVRLRRDDKGQSPEIAIKVGPKIFMATKRSAGAYYEASWKGADILLAQRLAQDDMGDEFDRDPYDKDRFFVQNIASHQIPVPATMASGGSMWQMYEVKTGMTQANTAMYDSGSSPAFVEESEIYESLLSGSNVDGSYPVSLSIIWPDGRKKIVFLGTYYVDGRAPQVTLDVKSKEIDGIAAFSDKITIIPHMDQREPVKRWEISVEDEDGNTLISENGKHFLPQHFTWRGQQSSGRFANDGEYQIVLKTWDRADNMALAVKKVMVVKEEPVVHVEATQRENAVCVDMSAEKRRPLAYWHVELRSQTGALLQEKEGNKLPVQLEISNEKLSEAGKVECLLSAKDLLGNSFKNKIEDIQLLADKKEKSESDKIQEQKVTEDWVEDF